MIWRGTLLLLCVVSSTVAWASPDITVPRVTFPNIPAQAQTKAGFVPKGWVVEKESSGDLNGDGVPDLMLVLHMDDPKNVVENSGLGVSELDTNPRMLVVAFADRPTKKYRSVLANHDLIPRQTNPVMDDPLVDAVIAKGTVQVSLAFFTSAGTWFTSRTRFTFRYQDECFKLIGYDSLEAKRNTGETSEISVNYLTKKAKITKGNFADDQTKVSWTTLRRPSLLCLDAIGDGLDFRPDI